ncbi:MAG: hypothetical protein ACXWUG_10235 [Polyangiales bacterium]
MFVPLLVVSILLLQAAIWIPVILVIKKRSRERLAAINAELAQAAAKGEQTRRGPQIVRVRRGHGTGTAAVAVTDRRIVFLAGERSELPLEAVREVRTDDWFNTSARAGYSWVILKLEDREVGLSVPSGEEKLWADAIRSAG